MMRNIVVTALLLGSTILKVGFASAHNNMRGLAQEENTNQEEPEKRELKSTYGARLKLYQMDTTRSTTAEWSEKEATEEGFSFSTQPFYQPLANGASGEMFYRPYGWTLLFSFAGRGLPPNTPYTLIYNPNSEDPSADLVCLGSDTVGRLGQILLVGNIELASNLPVATDRNKGAKIWLAPSADVNCEGTAKSLATEANHNFYLFPKENQFLKFDYLG